MLTVPAFEQTLNVTVVLMSPTSETVTFTAAVSGLAMTNGLTDTLTVADADAAVRLPAPEVIDNTIPRIIADGLARFPVPYTSASSRGQWCAITDIGMSGI